MSHNLEEQKRDLAEKILAKRQQVEFEKTNISLTTGFSAENNQNPDVGEEFKNLEDNPLNVVDKTELKELSVSEQELIYLIDKLNKLNKES